MIKRFIGIPVALMLFAGLVSAGSIDSLDIQLGYWDGTQFIWSGSEWNTYNANNWAIGATAPGYGNPLLTTYSPALDQFSLPDGEYWLYLAEDGDGSTAIQITLGYQGGGSVVEVFTSPDGAQYTAPYTLVSGSAFTANLVSGPQTTYELVAPDACCYYQAYYSDGTANWIVDLNTVPEPGSWMLLVAGLAAIAGIRRKLTGSM